MKNRLTVAALLGLILAFSLHARAEDKLKVGDPAPDFTLPMANQDTIQFSGIKLSQVEGKNNIILAFYPADWSGGCTTEMCNLRDNFTNLQNLGATVFGISGDYVFSHHQWAIYHKLPFDLLSDHDHAVAKTYQSFNPKWGMNLRTVYVIDRQGRIAYIDLAYVAGSADSYNRLKAAITSLH